MKGIDAMLGAKELQVNYIVDALRYYVLYLPTHANDIFDLLIKRHCVSLYAIFYSISCYLF